MSYSSDPAPFRGPFSRSPMAGYGYDFDTVLQDIPSQHQPRMTFDFAYKSAHGQAREGLSTVLCFYKESVTEGKDTGTNSVFWYDNKNSHLVSEFLARRASWGEPDEKGRYAKIVIFDETGKDVTSEMNTAAEKSVGVTEQVPTPWRFEEYRARQWDTRRTVRRLSAFDW